MKGLRLLILLGQVGKIWAKTHKARKIYQTITALGFFSMLYSYNKDKPFKNSER